MNEILYHTKFLDLKKTISATGSPWYYAHRPNAENVVVILPIYNDEILFLLEKRPPVCAENKGKYAVGTVAGLVGDCRIGESVEDAISAELLEEAGLVTDFVEIKAVNVASSAGCVSETFIIALANIKDKTPIKKPIDDDGVIVDRIWVKKSDVRTWLSKMEKEGNVLTSQVLSALFYIQE